MEGMLWECLTGLNPQRRIHAFCRRGGLRLVGSWLDGVRLTDEVAEMKACRATAVFLGVMLIAVASGGLRSNATKVSIKDLAYTPASVNVTVGGTVTWSNDDDRDHTVRSTDGTVDSGNISPGKTFSHTFKTAGKFSYGCALHPRMKGTVVVAEK